MRRRRLFLYAALALAVPVPAFALELTGQGSPAVGSLAAHASLDGCGLFEQQIVCKVDVGFSQIAGADRYSASVTAPDGSVADYGDVGAGGASVWVPYVGDGTYTVTVEAWGQPPSPKAHPKLLTSDRARTSRAAPTESGVATTRLQGTAQTVAPDARGGGRLPVDPTTPSDGSPSPSEGDGTTTTTTTTTPAPPTDC